MTKNTLALCGLFCCFSSSVFALDVITEEDLSAVTAQDGITVLIGLPSNGWRANEISLTDTNGIAPAIMAGYNSAGTILAKNVGFSTCSNGVGVTCTPISGASIQLKTDAVGDSNGAALGGGAMLNLSFSLIGGANKIRFFIDEIKLRNGPSGASEKVLIDFLQNYVDIVPIGSSSLFAMQLGNESLGHMLHFTNGNFGTIDFGTLAFIDGTNPSNSLRFGFRLDEFDITGAGFDVDATGLVFSDANFGKGSMDVTLTDVRMGGAGAASMGTFGVQNISIANLAVTIAGKN